MSADCGWRWSLALLAGMLGSGFAVAEESPDLEFLEYLGSWEAADEDWLLFRDDNAEQLKADDKRNDPAPTGEESTETDDEY
jgi:hypothetical protein